MLLKTRESLNAVTKQESRWKLGLLLIVFCYPIAGVAGKLVAYVALRSKTNPSPVDKLDAIGLGNNVTFGLGAVVWLFALVVSVQAARRSDTIERQLGRYVLTLVVIAGVAYLIAVICTKLAKGIQLY